MTFAAQTRRFTVLLAAACLTFALATVLANTAAAAVPAAKLVIPPALHLTLASGRSYHLSGALGGGIKHELIIVLPGLYLSPDTTEKATGFSAFGLTHNTTVAYGASAAGYSGFNAGGCCGSAVNRVDDLTYVTDIVTAVEARLPIDKARVYIAGFSTGGMMAERAACSYPGIFAAAGPVAGDLLVPCPR